MDVTRQTLVWVIVLNLVPSMEGQYGGSYRAQQDAASPAADDMEHVWSGWGRWSACSMTCGQGTRSRRRECVGRGEGQRLVRLEKPTCHGKDKEYTKCQDRDCRPGAEDLHSYQCSQRDDDVVLDQMYEWIPFHGGPNVCELTCMEKEYGFTYNFGAVTDGTPCSKTSDKICIEGRCASVGCDGMVGSNAVLDNCRVCHGQNANCVHYKNSYDNPAPRRGRFDYTDIVTVPKGAAQILVKDASENYLAVRDARGQYVFNGKWIIDWSGRYDVAGTTVEYNRAAINETLSVEGPTKEELVIVLMFRDRNPGVRYSFYLPRDKVKEIVVPSGSEVTQSDSQPGSANTAYQNPYGKDRVSHNKPYKHSGSNHNHGVSPKHDSTADNTKINSQDRVSPGYGNPWDEQTDDRDSGQDAYLRQWLRAFSPGTEKPKVSVTPWPNPVYTVPPRPTSTTVSPEIYTRKQYVFPTPGKITQAPTRYPVRSPIYPTRPPNYPERQPNYPELQPSYPDRGSSYPERQPGYPERQTGYPERQPGYPEQSPTYPKQPPSYPGQSSNQPIDSPSYPEIQKPWQSHNGHQTTHKQGLSGHSSLGQGNAGNRKSPSTTATTTERPTTSARPKVTNGATTKKKPKRVPETILQYDRLVEIPEFFRYRKPSYCGTCRKAKGFTRSFCSHDFVVKAKVLDYHYFGNNTRYDMRILHTFRNTNFELMTREFIWVPNRCRCPELRINQVFLVMGNLVENYRDTQDMRLVVTEDNFVRKFNKSYEDKLKNARKRAKCSSRG